jgi:sentrin-specific protease 8
MGEPILLTYRNTTLRRSDVALFKGTNWLNDTCINFYYDWLTAEGSCPGDVLLVDPSTSFLCVFENDLEDLEPTLRNLGMGEARYIFLPITDNAD